MTGSHPASDGALSSRPGRLTGSSTTRKRPRSEADGPTDDKPTVTLMTPPDPGRSSAFLNVPVADIQKVYQEWSAKGAEFSLS